MAEELEIAKQSLEEIASKAKEIKNSLLPVERRIRETSVELPKTIILSVLYEELIAIQRIALLKSSKLDDSILTRMKGRALFSFVGALYMPVKQTDFSFRYNDFYNGSLSWSSKYLSSSGEGYSLDLILQANNPKCRGLINLPTEFVLENTKRTPEIEVNAQRLRDLQYFYELKVDKFFREHVGLLKLIRKKLGGFAEFDLEKLEERKILTTIPNVPIKIFGEILNPFYQKEERIIIKDMIKSDDWPENLEAIQSLINDIRNPRFGNLRRNRVLSTDCYFTPAQLASAPKREDIVGIDDNLRRLEALVRGYAKGRSTPNILLLGPGGVGKTTSLRYVLEVTKDMKNVRYFLMGSLEDVKQLAELNNGYSPVGIIDDLRGEVNQTVYARLKQQLEGLGDTLFNKVLIIISANPEIWNDLEDSVKQRLSGVELKYQPNPKSYGQLVRQFCNKFGVQYKSEIVEQVKEMVPRQVRDYIRALGSEQVGLESKA